MSEPEVVTIDDRLPSLEIPAPRCGHCGNDVTMDDGAAWCEHCLVVWDRIEDGHRSEVDQDAIDPDGTATESGPCRNAPAVAEQTEDRGPSILLRQWGPCILPVGHSSDHLHPLTRAWSMKPECGAYGGAASTPGGSTVPDSPCIREHNHPGDHANGSRYWPRTRVRCTQQFENRYACEDCTGSPHEHHYQTGVGPHGIRVTWTTATPTL